MPTSQWFRALLCGLVVLGAPIGVGAGLANPPIAAALPSPPVAANVDDLGVDLTTGQFRVAQTSLSIGGSGSGSTLTGGYTEYAYDARGNVTTTSVVSKNGTSTLASGTPYPTSCGNTKTCNKPRIRRYGSGWGSGK